MDGVVLSIWILRLLFLALLYLFLWAVVRGLLRDLRAAAREPGAELGRLVVVASPSGEPAPGASISLDAVTTLGWDVNNTVVVDDEFVSGSHAVPSYRGRTWYVEDLGSTNGTRVDRRAVTQAVLQPGDRIEVGTTELRFERLS